MPELVEVAPRASAETAWAMPPQMLFPALCHWPDHGFQLRVLAAMAARSGRRRRGGAGAGVGAVRRGAAAMVQPEASDDDDG